MIPAYWGQISNRTADPTAFLDVPGSDAYSVSLPGGDSVCPLTAGREGSREPSGRQEPHGEALVGLRLLSSESLFHHKIFPCALNTRF